MAAALPTPDDCKCECFTTSTITPTGTSPQQLFDGDGPPVGLQVGVGGLQQNPIYPAKYTDKLTGITYNWNTFTFAWDF